MTFSAAMEPLVRVGTEDFDVGAEYAAARGRAGGAGALVTFTGCVRDLIAADAAAHAAADSADAADAVADGGNASVADAGSDSGADSRADSGTASRAASGTGPEPHVDAVVDAPDRVTALELEHYPGLTERSVEAVAREAARRWPLLALTVVHRVGRLLPGDQIVLVVAASSHRHAAFDAACFVMDYLKTRAVFWKKELSGSGAHWIESRADDHRAAGAWSDPDPDAAGVPAAGVPAAGDRAPGGPASDHR